MPREGRGSCSLHWCLSRWGEDPEDHPHPSFRHVTGPLPPQLQGNMLGGDFRVLGLLQQHQTLLLKQLQG